MLAGKGDEHRHPRRGPQAQRRHRAPPTRRQRRRPHTFDLRNYDGDEHGTAVPVARSNGAHDPETRPAHRQPPTSSAATTQLPEVRQGRRRRCSAKGSVPDIKRVALQPGAVRPERPALPAGGGSRAEGARVPVRRTASRRRNRRSAYVRTQDDKNEMLAIEEGLIDSVPAGAAASRRRSASRPTRAKLDPICGRRRRHRAAGCRPTCSRLQAPQNGSQTTNLQARLAIGDETLVNDLKAVVPLDEYSKRLNYEAARRQLRRRRRPRDRRLRGRARVKLGTAEAGDAGAASASTSTCRTFLDLDPPTL